MMQDHRKNKPKQNKRIENPQSYRFRRVLGDLLRYLNNTDGEEMFSAAKEEFGLQLNELVSRGYTWGYSYQIPTHPSDFKSLNRKEWAAIRAIVRKYQYNSPKKNSKRV